MKICIVTTAFPRWANDGRGVFIYEAARAIQNQGHQVRIIAMHNPGSKTYEMMDGLEVIRTRYLPDCWEILQKDSAGIPLAWKSNPWARLALLPFFVCFLYSIIRWSKGFDIVHANWTLAGAAAWIAELFTGIPFIVTIHGSDIFQAAKMPLFRKVTGFVLRKSQAVIAVSQALVDEAHKLGVPPEKCRVISNGVNLANYQPLDETLRELVILYAGSLIKRKAVDILIQAFARLPQALSVYKLVIVGEGACDAELKALAHQLAVSDRVIFTGFQSQVAVQEWMRKSRLFVLPSTEEGQGVVLLEALASGTPCVGTRVGGIPGVITPDVGQLVPPGDADLLCQAISDVVQSTQWAHLSRSARLRAEMFYDWNYIAREILVVYSDVVKGC